jgi:hypothetical protein
MSKVQEKNKAQALRRQGWGIKDIAVQLSVSKGSVSAWCQEIVLTKKQQDNLRKNRWLLDMLVAYAVLTLISKNG